jgi:hypothetical protein
MLMRMAVTRILKMMLRFEVIVNVFFKRLWELVDVDSLHFETLNQLLILRVQLDILDMKDWHSRLGITRDGIGHNRDDDTELPGHQWIFKNESTALGEVVK